MCNRIMETVSHKSNTKLLLLALSSQFHNAVIEKQYDDDLGIIHPFQHYLSHAEMIMKGSVQ